MHACCLFFVFSLNMLLLFFPKYADKKIMFPFLPEVATVNQAGRIATCS